jgi:NitT/TauT family transport system substrate-binding protein
VATGSRFLADPGVVALARRWYGQPGRGLGSTASVPTEGDSMHVLPRARSGQRRFRRQSIGVLLLVAVGVALAACAPAPTAPTAAAPAAKPGASQPAPTTVATAAPTAVAPAAVAPRPIQKVTVGVLGSFSDAPIYIAGDRGYLAEQGIEIETIRFGTSGEMFGPLATGQLLVGTGGVNAALFNALSRDVGIQFVANKSYLPPGFPRVGWVVRTALLDEGKVREPRDLRGLNVGIPAAGSAVLVELEELLRRGNLTANDVATRIVTFSDQPAAFANAALDFAYTTEPTTTTLIEQRFANMWVYSGDLVPNHEGSVVMYSPAFMGQYPELAKGWMVAYLRGVRDYVRAFDSRQIPDDMVKTILDHGLDTDPERVRRTVVVPMNPDGYNFPESLQKDLDFFVKEGTVQNPPDLSKAINSTFVDHAVAGLGKYQR